MSSRQSPIEWSPASFTDTRRIAQPKKKRRTPAEAALDRFIEQCAYRAMASVQIDIMDIGKIYEAGRTASLAGLDQRERLKAIEAAIVAKVAELRKN